MKYLIYHRALLIFFIFYIRDVQRFQDIFDFVNHPSGICFESLNIAVYEICIHYRKYRSHERILLKFTDLMLPLVEAAGYQQSESFNIFLPEDMLYSFKFGCVTLNISPSLQIVAANSKKKLEACKGSNQFSCPLGWFRKVVDAVEEASSKQFQQRVK